MSSRRIRIRSTTSGLLVAAAIAAFVGAAPAPAAESVLKVVPLNDLKIVDPIWLTGYTSRDHGYMVWDTLFALDENLKPQPQMVESWTVSDDNLNWTFKLRDGLKWHDGGDVTAEDCVPSLKRWAARDTHGQILAGYIASMTAKDAKTLEIKLNKPFGLMLEVLGKPSGVVPFIMPKRIAETDPFQPIKESIGSGPFLFKQDEWVIGSKVVYVKNPNYVPRKEPPSGAAGAKIAKVDRVEWHTIDDSATAMNALMRGEVDYWLQPPADLLKPLSANKQISVVLNDPLGTVGIMRMNHLQPPFNNKKVRQAVQKALDQEMYLQAGFGDPKYYKSCFSVYACGSPWETEAGNEIAKVHSLDEGKKLLKESGYSGQKAVILQATDNPSISAFAAVSADLLKQLGMTVEMQSMDFQTLVARRSRKDPVEHGGWSMFLTNAVSADFLDPFSIGLSAAGEKGWIGWADDPEIEKLKQQFAGELDVEKKKAITRTIQERAFDLVSYVPLGVYYGPIAYRNNVSGILRSPLHLYWNIAVQQR